MLPAFRSQICPSIFSSMLRVFTFGANGDLQTAQRAAPLYDGLFGGDVYRYIALFSDDPCRCRRCQFGQRLQHAPGLVGRYEHYFAVCFRRRDHTSLRTLRLAPFGAHGCRPHDGKGVVLDRSGAAPPSQPHLSLNGRSHGIDDRAARPGIDRHTLRAREIAHVETKQVQPRLARAVTFGRRGVPGLGRHRHDAGSVGQQRQFVACILRDQTHERHRGPQAGRSGASPGRNVRAGAIAAAASPSVPATSTTAVTVRPSAG